MNLDDIGKRLQSSADTLEALVQAEGERIEQVARMLVEVFEGGGWLYLLGNGGSASDAEHIAAEFVGRFLTERRPLPALALTTNSSQLTAISNDYGYEQVFSRQIEAFCSEADMVLGFSTSGSSPNVLSALRSARKIGCKTIGLTGNDPSKMQPHCDVVIAVPSRETPRIQESHITIGHIICEYVESQMFG